MARWSILAGLALGAFIALVLGRSLLPQPTATPSLWALWWLSLCVLLAGLLRAIADANWLRKEWAALEQARFDPEGAKKTWSGSIVATRIRFVDDAIAERRASRDFRQVNRAEAAAASAGIASVSRFLSSALLVLAVMGTFAGMKTALPPLIEAIQTAARDVGSSSGTGAVPAGTSGDEIGEALHRVADAFGANLIALFGSLFLAGAAFGASTERKRFLAQLERVSEDRLYRLLPADADASELQRAVLEMKQSATEVGNIALGVTQLATSVSDLRSTLRDTLSEMHASFSDSVRQHSVELQTQLNTAVAGLTGTLSGATKALELTSVAYEGLVKGLEERDLGVRSAAAELERNARTLGEMTGRLDQSAATAANANFRAASVISEAQKFLSETLEQNRAASMRVAEAVERQDTASRGMLEELVAIKEWNGALRRQIAEVGANVAGEIQSERKASDEQGRALQQEIRQVGERLGKMTEALNSEQQQAAAFLAKTMNTSLAALDQASSERMGTVENNINTGIQRLEAMHETISAQSSSSHQTRASLIAIAEHVQGEIAALRRELGDAMRTVQHNAAGGIQPGSPFPNDGMRDQREHQRGGGNGVGQPTGT